MCACVRYPMGSREQPWPYMGICDVNGVTWPKCAILIGRDNFCCALIGRDLKGPLSLLIPITVTEICCVKTLRGLSSVPVNLVTREMARSVNVNISVPRSSYSLHFSYNWLVKHIKWSLSYELELACSTIKLKRGILFTGKYSNNISSLASLTGITSRLTGWSKIRGPLLETDSMYILSSLFALKEIASFID